MKETGENVRRIGVHLGIAGGAFKAAERAHAIGANTFQIFSSSPRMWRASPLDPEVCVKMKRLRELYDCSPLVIHTSYLVNLCSQSEKVRSDSVEAFRGEVQRAIDLGAEYLVLHPGSWKGLTREGGLRLAVGSIESALEGIDWEPSGLTILIENTAGAEFSLGSSLEQVAELVLRLKRVARIACCLDTCHVHVAGYDIVSAAGYETTVRAIESTVGLQSVKLWHANDAKANRGSRLDRHEHIGEGTIGIPPFRRLLNDSRFSGTAFIAETPIDDPDDDMRNVTVLRSLLATPRS